MVERTVIVVGAGPAGGRAAARLVEAGLRPIVIDEGIRDGGQIYRRQPEGFTRPPSVLSRGRDVTEFRRDLDWRCRRPVGLVPTACSSSWAVGRPVGCVDIGGAQETEVGRAATTFNRLGVIAGRDAVDALRSSSYDQLAVA